MARSQNGWPAYASGTDPNLVAIPEIAGRVRKGDVATIFEWFVTEFARTVEPVAEAAGQPQDDWGFSNRPVTGGRALSNHASGTAIDINATRHPYRKSGTFTRAQVARIEAMLAWLEHVVRWGGHYKGTKDEMHFEINAGEAAVARLARKIREGTPAAPVIPPTRFVDVPKSHTYYSQVEWAAVAGITTGYPDATFRPDAILTRADAAVMLFRLTGGAELKDVPLSHPFALAIGWMQGSSPAIARGFGNGTFAPDAVVTRVDAAIFLHRLAGEPAAAKADGTFSDLGDLPKSAQVACSWLFQAGISKGFVTGTRADFRPTLGIARADWIVFLNRFQPWLKR